SGTTITSTAASTPTETTIGGQAASRTPTTGPSSTTAATALLAVSGSRTLPPFTSAPTTAPTLRAALSVTLVTHGKPTSTRSTTAVPPRSTSTSSPGGTLPFTGLPIWIVTLAGLGLIG